MMKGLDINMIRNVDLDLLQKTYLNASIGITALEAVLNKPDSKRLYTELRKHLRDYQELADRSKEQIVAGGAKVKEQSPYVKAMMKSNVKLHTLVATSDSHIAEMVIRGSIMGVTHITRLLHSSKNADGTSTEIAEEFIRKEEEYIKTLKDYL